MPGQSIRNDLILHIRLERSNRKRERYFIGLGKYVNFCLLIMKGWLVGMAQQKIKFREADDIREFVNAAEKCDFDIDVCYNRVMVDAKSIMGIFSLGLYKILTVRCHGESEDFECAIRKFAVA